MKTALKVFVLIFLLFLPLSGIAAAGNNGGANLPIHFDISGGSSFFLNDRDTTTTVSLRNTGEFVWPKEQQFALIYQWLDKQGNLILNDGSHTLIAQDLAPGEKITLQTQIITPKEPGSYKLQWGIIESKSDGSPVWSAKTVPLQSIHVLNRYIITLLVYFATLLVIAAGLILFRKIRWITSVNRYLSSRWDILWFILSVFGKVLFFSYDSDIRMNVNALVLSLLFVLFLATLLNLFSAGNLRFISVTAINALFSAFMLADMVYIAYFQDVLTIPVLLYMNQMESVGNSVTALLNFRELFFVADLLLGVAIYIFWKRKLAVPNSFRLSIGKKLLATSICCMLLTFLYADRMYAISKQNDGLFLQRFSNSKMISYLGVLNYHLYDGFEFVQSTLHKPKFTDTQIKTFADFLGSDPNSQTKNANWGIAKGKNVIMIQVEALQEFAIGLKIQGKEVTPNLNKLIKDSIYFSNYFNQTNQGRTSDAEFSSLTSLLPLNAGSVYISYPQQNYESLPKQLKMQGYTTFSAHAYNGQFWNRIVMHKQLGIDTSMFEPDFHGGETIGMGLSDKDYLEQALPRLLQLPQPFFSFLITLSNHHPYEGLPKQYQAFDMGELDNSLLGRYVNTVHYTDMALGDFIDNLKNNGLYDHSVLAIYGDHDSAIDINDIAKVADTGTEPIDAAYKDKVPLIIHIPGYGKNGANSTVSGHLDLTPSLMYLLGINSGNVPMLGYNLFEPNPDKVVVLRRHNGSFVDAQHYFLTPDGSLENGECYDLGTDQTVDRNACAPHYNVAQMKINISDSLIKGNLVAKVEEAE